MARIQKFEVKLDNDKTEYVPGDVVNGHAEIEIASGSMDVTAVSAQLVGKAYCGWSQEKYWHSDTQFTCDDKYNIYGEGASGSSKTGALTQGAHRMPFRFQLKNDLVSSYKDAVGYVKYTIKLKVITPQQSETKTKRVINVRRLLDLRTLQNMAAPSSGTEETSVCCSCRGGLIECEVRTDKTGYVPGDSIVANATLKNNSSTKVKKTTLSIARRVTYLTAMKIRKTPWVIAAHKGPSCAPGKTINLNNMKLQVPDAVPTDTSLRIMKFEYAVMLRAYLRACTVDPRTFAPITIGTVQSTGSGQAPASAMTSGTDFSSSASPPGQSLGETNQAFYDWNQSSAFTYTNK